MLSSLYHYHHHVPSIINIIIIIYHKIYPYHYYYKIISSFDILFFNKNELSLTRKLTLQKETYFKLKNIDFNSIILLKLLFKDIITL
jgi:hypothetical protein